MNVKGVCCKVLLKQVNPNAKPDFRSAVQKDFKLGFVQPYRFCHVKWIELSGKNYTAARGNLFEAGYCVRRHLENRNSFATFWSYQKVEEKKLDKC